VIARNDAAEMAFTLLELLATLAILSVLAAGTLLAWPKIEAALSLETGLHQLAADLHAARTLAIASASRVRLVFVPATSTYRRERKDDTGIYRLDVTHELPRGIKVIETNSAGNLTYSARGQAENGTVVLGDRRGVRRALRLNQRGRITILRTGL